MRCFKKTVAILVHLFCMLSLLVMWGGLKCSENQWIAGRSDVILAASAYDYNGTFEGSYGGTTSSLDDFTNLEFSDLEDLFSDYFDYSVSDIMNELITLMGDAATTSFIILLIISALWCFLGYRIYPVFVAIESFLWSLLIGTTITLFSESAIWLLVFPVAGVILAILCVRFDRLGAFLIGLVNCWFMPTLISMIMTESFKNGLIVGTIIAVICGIITAIFKKPIIIIGSVLNYGPVAGTALACLMVKTEWGLPLQVLFVVAGFFVQTKINNGLLERGSLITYLRNLFTPKPKVEAGSLEWKTPPVSAPSSVSHVAPAAPVDPVDSVPVSTAYCVCPHCDTRNHAGDAFCYCCGHSLPHEPAISVPTPATHTPSPVITAAPEAPVVTAAKEHKSFVVSADESSSVSSAGGKLKFSGFSSGRTESSGSVVIKMGGVPKSTSMGTETMPEDRSPNTLKITNDFDDE